MTAAGVRRWTTTVAGKDQRGKTNQFNNGPMAKETRHQTTKGHQALLDVWGFDLLAHVEAMLRHARQYKQEVKQLRSHLGKGQTDQIPLDAVLQHVKELQRSSALFSETLGEIVGALELVKTERKRRAP